MKKWNEFWSYSSLKEGGTTQKHYDDNYKSISDKDKKPGLVGPVSQLFYRFVNNMDPSSLPLDPQSLTDMEGKC